MKQLEIIIKRMGKRTVNRSLTQTQSIIPIKNHIITLALIPHIVLRPHLPRLIIPITLDIQVLGLLIIISTKKRKRITANKMKKGQPNMND